MPRNRLLGDSLTIYFYFRLVLPKKLTKNIIFVSIFIYIIF